MANYNGQFQDSNGNGLLGTPHSYANIEGDTSSQAYTIGQMVVFNNRLCEIISTVAQGDAFEIGVNVAYKTVGQIGEQLIASDGSEFYFDIKDGRYGYYPSASKTASEFVPFKGSLVDIGNVVYGNISGSHTYTNYPFTVCYVSDSKICLLGNLSLENSQWSGATSYVWSVTFAAGVITGQAKTVSNVKIPTHQQIYNTTSGYVRNFAYWTSTINYTSDTNYVWCVRSSGAVAGDQPTWGDRWLQAIPYVEINL